MVGTRWRKAITEELARHYRPGQSFTLTDFYRRSEPRLQAMWPNNSTVQATIRRELQKLRDAGLLAFHGHGKYTYHGGTGRPPATPSPRPGLGQAVYDLAARITAETGVAASDYLAVARAPQPEAELRTLLVSGRASKTFLALHTIGELSLSLEKLTIDRAHELGLSADLVSAARDRIAYYESDGR